MRVRYTPQALAEREAIFDCLEQRNSRAAGDVVGLIARRIAEQPYMGHPTDRPGIHTLWIKPRPYRVFYRIDGEGVVILHIRHTSRRLWGGEQDGE